MFIELIDSLRCPVAHADSWLVASILARRDRFIIEGRLGCPVCGNQYAIAQGVARFDVPDSVVTPVLSPSAAHDDEAAIRAAAFLQMSEGGTYVLGGAWADLAASVSALIPARIFALNAREETEESEQVGLIVSAARIPLGAGTARGAAFDEGTASAGMLESAVRCLAPGGRLVGPHGAAIPQGVAEIARDSELWIAERPPALVRLARA